jgi:hypothetical protein
MGVAMYCSKCGALLAENATFCTACGQPTSIRPAGIAAGLPTAQAPSVQYAGFWLRFVAYLIDSIRWSRPNTVMVTLP